MMPLTSQRKPASVVVCLEVKAYLHTSITTAWAAHNDMSKMNKAQKCIAPVMKVCPSFMYYYFLWHNFFTNLNILQTVPPEKLPQKHLMKNVIF